MNQVTRKRSANMVVGFVLAIGLLLLSSCASTSSSGAGGEAETKKANNDHTAKSGADKRLMSLGTLEEHFGQDDGLAGVIFYSGEIAGSLEVCG